MYVFKKEADLQKFLKKKKEKGKTIGFVPTMGALHNGHLSLIKKARKLTDVVVCSIFVNPTQFNEVSDLEKYPRTIPQDMAMLIDKKCHVLFLPSIEEVYPDGTTSKDNFDFGKIGTVLEAAHRPGHFDGVAQVVKRLVEMVCPDKMLMGQKDFQQFMIVKTMLKQANLPLDLVMCPIIREKDGLAMSSRNVRLTKEERNIAPQISGALKKIKDSYRTERIDVLEHIAIRELEKDGVMKVDYLEVVDADTLLPLERWRNAENIVVCTAVHLGEVRLIDNMIIKGVPELKKKKLD